MLGIVLLFVAHFVADFVLQSREMAKKKSHNIQTLIDHCSIHFAIVLIFLIPFYSIMDIIGLLIINCFAHGLIDWYLWRGYKFITFKRLLVIADDKANVEQTIKDFRYWDDHYFYLFIGLDQLLHSLTLITLASLYL